MIEKEDSILVLFIVTQGFFTFSNKSLLTGVAVWKLVRDCGVARLKKLNDSEKTRTILDHLEAVRYPARLFSTKENIGYPKLNATLRLEVLCRERGSYFFEQCRNFLSHALYQYAWFSEGHGRKLWAKLENRASSFNEALKAVDINHIARNVSAKLPSSTINLFLWNFFLLSNAVSEKMQLATQILKRVRYPNQVANTLAEAAGLSAPKMDATGIIGIERFVTSDRSADQMIHNNGFTASLLSETTPLFAHKG